MKGKPAPDREIVGSPFEVAQLAVSLATMRGETEFRLKEAAELLENAALFMSRRRQFPKPAMFVESDARAEDVRKRSGDAGDDIMLMTPTSHPEEWAEHLKRQRSSPAAQLIKPPVRYPVERSGFWRALLGGRPGRKEIDNAEKRFAGAFRIKWPLTESNFWSVALYIAQGMPRFSPHPGPKRRQKRSKGERTFFKPERGEDGRFARKSGK